MRKSSHFSDFLDQSRIFSFCLDQKHKILVRVYMIMNFLEYTSISKIKPSCQTLSAELFFSFSPCFCMFTVPFKFLFCFFFWFVCAQYLVRRRLLDLLVPGSFPDQLYRVGREVIKNKVDFLFFFLTHGNLSKQTVGREVKKESDFLASTKIHT